MKKYAILVCVAFVLTSFKGIAQEMTSGRLSELIINVSDSTQVEGNSIRFSYKGTMVICVYDENANRMRIITPIVKKEDIEEEELLNALVANFHSALDVKYALSDEIIWSVFIHPLKELADHQVLDAIDQVYAAAATFGTSYSSTSLVFPGNTQKKERPKKRIERKKI